MGHLDKLESFRKKLVQRIDGTLTAHFDAAIDRMTTIDPTGGSVARVIRDFVIQGGKRFRPILVATGYGAFSQRSWEDVVQPAISTELFHAFFLIHDDIMDRSDLRRGHPTVHRVFQKALEKEYGANIKDLEHVAKNVAMLAGDLCCQMAYDALLTAPFGPGLIMQAQRHLRTMSEATIVGQLLDMLPAREPSEGFVTKSHRLKTAVYTFEAPLHLGMIFAQANDDDLKAMSKYAIPLGLAYQIQDDLLGVFGSEEKVGKPVTSDIEEGKETFLTLFVREHGSDRQRALLASFLGKPGLTQIDLEGARTLFTECGAVKYSEERARKLVDEGKAALREMDLPSKSRRILEEIADHTINRIA